MTLPKTQVAFALMKLPAEEEINFLLYVCGHRDFFINPIKKTLQEVKIHE